MNLTPIVVNKCEALVPAIDVTHLSAEMREAYQYARDKQSAQEDALAVLTDSLELPQLHLSRHRLNDLLRLFDFPDPNITAGERSVTTVPLQQLFVLNSDFMIVQAKALAARLSRETESDAGRINRLFQLLYGRLPTDDDYKVSAAFLQEPSAEARDSLSRLEQYCLAMLGTNEFAYID